MKSFFDFTISVLIQTIPTTKNEGHHASSFAHIDFEKEFQAIRQYSENSNTQKPNNSKG